MPATAMGAAIPNNNFVIMDPITGPTGAVKAGTGALSTGIGYGASVLGSLGQFTDDHQPGTKYSYTPAAIPVGAMMYIGGGKSLAGGAPDPYTAGTQLLGFGHGGARDGGAGPIYTGFGLKAVTAAGSVANGAVVETGFVNRTNVALASGQHTFGSASAASAAVA
jgi:hypothetical protein